MGTAGFVGDSQFLPKGKQRFNTHRKLPDFEVLVQGTMTLSRIQLQLRVNGRTRYSICCMEIAAKETNMSTHTLLTAQSDAGRVTGHLPGRFLMLAIFPLLLTHRGPPSHPKLPDLCMVVLQLILLHIHIASSFSHSLVGTLSSPSPSRTLALALFFSFLMGIHDQIPNRSNIASYKD